MFVVRLVAASPCPFAGQDRLADGTSFWSVELGRPGAEGGRMVARGAAKSKVSALPKNASFRADDRRERERERERETDDDFVVNRSAS